MEALLNYFQQVIKPRSDKELVVAEKWPLDPVQDAIVFLLGGAYPPAGIEFVTVGDWKLARNNRPRNIAWFNEETGEFSWRSDDLPIYRRLVPPPYETLDHVKVISNIILSTNGLQKTYLEYGVRSGSSIEPISALVFSAVGVDISGYVPRAKNITFKQTTTDNFSEKFLPSLTFHYAFIDADHSSKQVLEDFSHVWQHIQKDGYIFLHDTYPCLQEMIQPRFCNDCYLVPLTLKKVYKDIEIVTLPLNPGLTIVRKL